MSVDRFPIEEGHIMLFARAVGDENPIYHDAEEAKGTEPGHIIGPPTFIQASAQFDDRNSLRPQVGQPWFGSGKAPTGTPERGSGGGGGGTGLHAEQHYEYHRHPKPGDVLHSKVRPGESWEREGRRGGKLKFSETITDYFDQTDELVITARSVSVQTERVVEQE